MAPRSLSVPEIARETLKQLAVRKLVPTPDNYQALYEEVSGAPAPSLFPDRQLRAIHRNLPGQTPGQRRLLGQFEEAIAQQDWVALQTVLVAYANQGLKPVPTPDTAIHQPEPVAVLPDDLSEQIARLVDNALHAVGEDDARVHELAGQVTRLLREGAAPASTLVLMLNNFSYRLSFATEEQASIREMLLTLLQTLFENIAALSPEDEWLFGQVEALQAASTPPLTLRRLDEVQLRLKDVIFKQTEARARQVEAQEQMKELLATFVDRLAKMTDSSDHFHSVMEQCSEVIVHANKLEDITPVLAQVMSATRAMALDSRLAHDELEELRERAEEKRAEVAQLQAELDRASAQARHDPLTGAFNRKGLDEMMEREIARARRSGAPLCVALLDVDNFKGLNDRLGHDTGDAALVHLANVTRSVMRLQDMLARYGGEEFVLVLPHTLQSEGVEAMTRLQRELTKRFFLQNNEKVLITFSAGVAQVNDTETSAEALRRADQGMYQAKRAGKNRVVAV